MFGTHTLGYTINIYNVFLNTEQPLVTKAATRLKFCNRAVMDFKSTVFKQSNKETDWFICCAGA